MAQHGRNDPVAAGETALVRCDWPVARTCFEEALAVDPSDARALDGLGRALFWLGEWNRAAELRERAYVEYRRRGDARRAAAAALYVATDHRAFAGNEAAWAGWLARAERCLEGLEPCPEHGEIEIERARAARSRDLESSERHAERALALARQLQDPGLEIMALAQMGLALVERGRWEDGMTLLDEATAAALSGEVPDPWAIADALCQTLVACDQIADLRRASEWCRIAIDYSERHNYTPIHGYCRAIFAGVLMSSGDWRRAERELTESLRRYDASATLGSRVLPLVRMAELRLRQGRREEAERLLEGCQAHPLALVAVARLRLLDGDAETAVAMLERRLTALPDGAPGSAQLLAALVDAHLAREDRDSAAAAAATLAQLGGRLRGDDVRALGELALADVRLADDRTGAIEHLEVALELFTRAGMPYEEAETRLRLARAFAAAGSRLAGEEARRALAIFEDLGALRKADEAAALLRSLGEAGRTPVRTPGELTAREREVLALLAEGLSNAQIAERLVISEKTAGHHVSRIFRKLGLHNRAQAAAYALRETAGTP